MKHYALIFLTLLPALCASAARPFPGDTVIAENPPAHTDTVSAADGAEAWAASPLAYGLFIGTGPRWTAGRLNQYFSWAWDFTIGAQLSFYRAYLEGSVTFASPTLKKVNLTTGVKPDEKFKANVKNANYTAYGFNVGYSVVDSRHFSITPFAGGKWTRYSWTSRPLDEEGEMVMPQRKMKVGDFNVDFGINFDWHFSSMIITAGGKTQSLTSSLRVTPYAVRCVYTDCTPGFNGWQLGVMIAYSARARRLRPITLPN